MDAKQRIEVAKINLKRAEQAKTVAETQKASAEQQQQEIEKQMLELGVTPDTIEAEIAQLSTAMEEELTKIETLIPKV